MYYVVENHETCVDFGHILAGDWGNLQFYESAYGYKGYPGIRPVVCLKTNIAGTRSASGDWDLEAN